MREVYGQILRMNTPPGMAHACACKTLCFEIRAHGAALLQCVRYQLPGLASAATNANAWSLSKWVTTTSDSGVRCGAFAPPRHLALIRCEQIRIEGGGDARITSAGHIKTGEYRRLRSFWPHPMNMSRIRRCPRLYGLQIAEAGSPNCLDHNLDRRH